MKHQKLVPTAILTLAIMALIVVFTLGSRPDNRLVHTFQSVNAFSFQYPDGWQYIIPEYNVLLLGKPQTILNQQPGPTFTVHRSLILIAEGSLENALNTYLQQGPLKGDQAWKKLSDITPGKLSDLPALTIDLQGNERPAWPEQHIRTTAVLARDSTIYLFSISSPVTDWESDRAVLESILNSVVIVE